ncbi:TOBE domain-containing protein [Kibdelosporangium philippinense]|uniref:TOBE domain-containing protein n=1 Tax=Kibdelosporangium philippinense TaxID=211113 RepID=A0ABS8Z4S9_9PSEU|nr:TOBE domain-containing protein [Kibdelosporangium philippinense]MCE7002918.1 TOBE domain-containing protein [Kibdelosporangium philippinense]
MALSIRNKLSGTVSAVQPGEVMATVKTRLAGGQEITAAITREAVDELGLADGTPVSALIKSTEVALSTEPIPGISIRNQLRGEVTSVASGGAMATVKVSVDGGELTAAITRDAVDELKLTAGAQVVALIKSTEISLTTV